MIEKITAIIYWEDGKQMSGHKMTVFKESEMKGHLKDGRPVWYDTIKNRWYYPDRVAKGEVKL